MKARVIHVITKLELGGAQQNTLYTVEHLDRGRFSVALWSGDGGMLNDEARRVPDLDFVIVPELVRQVNPWLDMNALLQLRSMLKDEVRFSKAPVIVHTHSSKAGILGRWAARLAGVPVIIHTFHGFGFNDFQSFPMRSAFIAAERVTGRITHRFIAVSEANREKAQALRIAGKDDVEVIRSGICIDEFSNREFDAAAKKKALGLDPDRPLALMVACLKPQKNPLDFVEVAAMVKEKAPAAQFALAGDGELRGEVEGAIRSRGLTDTVMLLGWRRDVPELMWAADVLVLTSLWEGLPRVYPQAIAAGVPIIGTMVDGAVEAVIDGRNGWLFKPRDSEGMAARVAELLLDPERARQMGTAGREILPEFDIDLMVRLQEELYERMLRPTTGVG